MKYMRPRSYKTPSTCRFSELSIFRTEMEHGWIWNGAVLPYFLSQGGSIESECRGPLAPSQIKIERSAKCFNAFPNRIVLDDIRWHLICYGGYEVAEMGGGLEETERRGVSPHFVLNVMDQIERL